MKPNRGVRGRGNHLRGGRGRGRNNWNNFNVRPQNARNWNQFNRYQPYQPYFSPRFPPPFFRAPPPPRPPSPLPGTEEYRQRNIQETSELIKRHLNTTGDEPFLLNPNADIENTNENQESEKSEGSRSTPSTKKNKAAARRPKSPADVECDVDEIHNKIIKHISKLSHSKKINFVNQGLTGYDVAVQQLQIQKRLELSRALRDMSNRTQDSADCEVINSIIPDIGIKIEDLPREVIARLSSTLGIELNQDGNWCNNQFNAENTPEYRGENNETVPENPLNTTQVSDFDSHSPRRNKRISPERQDSGLFKGRRFSNSFSDDDDILDDILRARRSSSTSTEDNTEQNANADDDASRINPDCNNELDSQKASFPFIKLRPTKDLLKIKDDYTALDESHVSQSPGNENVLSGEIHQAEILKPQDLEDVSNDNCEPQSPRSSEFDIRNEEIIQESKPVVACLKVRQDLQAPARTTNPPIKLDRSVLNRKITKTEKSRLKRQKSAARRIAKIREIKISRKFRRKLRDNQSEDDAMEETIADDVPAKKHWRSAGEKKQLPNNLPTIKSSPEHSHTSPVIPFAIFTENKIPKTSSSVSSQTGSDIGIVPKIWKDAACQCVEVKLETDSQTQTHTEEVRAVRKEDRRNMLSQIAEIEKQICELMKLRLSLYGQLMDDGNIDAKDQSRKRKCDASLPSGSNKRICRDEHSQTKSHSSNTQEKSAACNVAASSTECKVSRNKSSRHKETSTTSHSDESNKSVTDKYNSSSSHRSSRSKTKRDESIKPSKPVAENKSDDFGSEGMGLVESKERKEVLHSLSDTPARDENVDGASLNTNVNRNDRVPPLAEGSEAADCVQLQEEADSMLEFKDWSGSILVIEVHSSKVLSGNDEGTLYLHDLKTGKLLKSIQLGNAGITSICFSSVKDSHHKFYAGTFESKLYLLNSRRQKVMLTFDLDENPVQCMETNWGVLFIGATNGNLLRFSIKKNKIEDTISISQNSILTIRAVHEGARRVLLVATRHSPVTVRDAMSGLLMRTMESTSTPTIYSLLFHDNKVYCGTSQEDILVYTFQNGEFSSKYDKGRSSGVVCMNVVRNVLFAGCYNGNIYAYNTKTDKFIGSMVGPAGLFLSMTTTEDKIILATKLNHFTALVIPDSIKVEMT